MSRPHLSPEVLAYDDHLGRVGKILADELATGFDNCDAREIDRVVEALFTVPIPMVIFCPACGQQHIDKDNHDEIRIMAAELGIDREGDRAYSDWLEANEWDNPPHCSHECQFCKYTWRPADVPTTGVLAVKTKGQNDSPAPHEFAKTLADHQRERERILRNTHEITINVDNHLTPDAVEKLKAAFKLITIKGEDLMTQIMPDAMRIHGLTKDTAEAGMLHERENQRIEQYRRTLRVNDVLRDLRNTVMEIGLFRMRKTDVLAEIDAARTTISRINEGIER